MRCSCLMMFFFFNDTATTEIYTLSLHDALPICRALRPSQVHAARRRARAASTAWAPSRQAAPEAARSEEHTSELQSPDHLVCRLLLEKKKKLEHAHTDAYLSYRQLVQSPNLPHL